LELDLQHSANTPKYCNKGLRLYGVRVYLGFWGLEFLEFKGLQFQGFLWVCFGFTLRV
jgi:hypothetical protein